MFKILLTSKTNSLGFWIDLDKHNKKTFLKEVDRLFGKDTGFFIEDCKNVPFEFRHAGIGDKILADRFWDWKTYSKGDRDLLIRYIEYSEDDSSTLCEARAFFKEYGDRLPSKKEFDWSMFFND